MYCIGNYFNSRYYFMLLFCILHDLLLIIGIYTGYTQMTNSVGIFLPRNMFLTFSSFKNDIQYSLKIGRTPTYLILPDCLTFQIPVIHLDLFVQQKKLRLRLIFFFSKQQFFGKQGQHRLIKCSPFTSNCLISVHIMSQ